MSKCHHGYEIPRMACSCSPETRVKDEFAMAALTGILQSPQTHHASVGSNTALAVRYAEDMVALLHPDVGPVFNKDELEMIEHVVLDRLSNIRSIMRTSDRSKEDLEMVLGKEMRIYESIAFKIDPGMLKET